MVQAAGCRPVSGNRSPGCICAGDRQRLKHGSTVRRCSSGAFPAPGAAPDSWPTWCSRRASARGDGLAAGAAGRPGPLLCAHDVNGFEHELGEVRCCTRAGLADSAQMPLAVSLKRAGRMRVIRCGLDESRPFEPELERRRRPGPPRVHAAFRIGCRRSLEHLPAEPCGGSLEGIEPLAEARLAKAPGASGKDPNGAATRDPWWRDWADPDAGRVEASPPAGTVQTGKELQARLSAGCPAAACAGLSRLRLARAGLAGVGARRGPARLAGRHGHGARCRRPSQPLRRRACSTPARPAGRGCRWKAAAGSGTNAPAAPCLAQRNDARVWSRGK